jgi:hypothetical protein
LSTRRLPKVIALDSSSETIALGVCLNESEDLSISERIWVAHTLNDFTTGFDTGTLPLEDTQKDVSPLI